MAFRYNGKKGCVTSWSECATVCGLEPQEAFETICERLGIKGEIPLAGKAGTIVSLNRKGTKQMNITKRRVAFVAALVYPSWLS